MNPVVLIETDTAATRFVYRRFSAGTRQCKPQQTLHLEGAQAGPGEARPHVGPAVVEQIRVKPEDFQ